MADILITGGAGSFGRMLAAMLKDQGHHLRIFDLPSCDYDVFDGWENTTIHRGDILAPESLKNAVNGVDLVFHLAAVLPPGSEVDRERTFMINVEGTRVLLNACSQTSNPPDVVFTSSVHVYGDSDGSERPIGPDDPPRPKDWYAQSKVEAEKILFGSNLNFVNLRISGVVIPAFLDPPEPWAFQKDQKIELICLKDLATAMAALPGKTEAFGKTLILAGGKSWQVTGREYVSRWGEIMEIPLDEMHFLDHPGWFTWYDTHESQRILAYQNTTLDDFFTELEKAVQEALS
ncbi:MAG: NAD(P)-dependent oxidoreductase [Desulfobacterales bacterium]